MCTREFKGNWEQIKGELQAHDILKLSSLLELGKNEAELRDRLLFCKQHDIVLHVHTSIMMSDVYMDIVHIMKRERDMQAKALYEAKCKGIKIALQKRNNGEGCYGRPAVTLPADFTERIKECIQDGKPLETYRKKIHMKRSTFYKYVRIARKDMKVI